MYKSYKIIKNVIGRGGFDLTTMLTKIDTLWGEDNLTNEQRDELLTLAREGASTGHSVDLLAKIIELEQRVRALESAAAEPDAGDESTADDFVAGKWYYAGVKVAFEGKIYICIAPDGVACVWSPKDYPAYWKVVQ